MDLHLRCRSGSRPHRRRHTARSLWFDGHLICVNAGTEAVSANASHGIRWHHAMLGQGFRTLVAGFLVGLAFLTASPPAAAHGLHRNASRVGAHHSPVRVEPNLKLISDAGSVRRAAVTEVAGDQASVRGECPAASPTQSPGRTAALRSSSLAVSSGTAGGCHCSDANCACCGLACCGALSVSTPTLPVADRPILALSALAFWQERFFDTLLRPPR
jgi:hypothetical protein